MATAIGTQNPGLAVTPLAAELGEDACSFEFFQAVAVLQRLWPERRPVGEFSAPEDEVAHFRVNSRLGFPASEIQELELREDAPAEMTVNFIGLTGPMGVLPHPYSELILERLRAKDSALATFFDLFNHRAISLLYRAWERSRFPVTFGSTDRDRFSRYLLDLIGLGTPGLRDRQAIEDEALTHYLSLVAMHSRSAVALEQILADYFEVPVAVEQFTGAWVPLDRPTQCSMSEEESASCQLGQGAVVGDAVWDHQGRIRLRIGPLSLDRYNDFLPGGDAHAALQAMVRFYTNGALDAEAQLVLQRSQVPSVQLDFDTDRPARLGWVSWASTAAMNRDPDDAILAL
ncbi:MAG: type VI secretion system baseplate subunit TssG [Acidobacteriaceae bacterium]